LTPVIIGLTVTTSESFRQYLSNILAKHDIKELLKTAILDTAHTSQSSNVKVQNVYHGK